MGNWLGRFLGGSSRAANAGAAPSSTAAMAPSATTPASAADAWRPALDVDAVFCRWLLGQDEAAVAADDRAQVEALAKLDALASGPGLATWVPRVPSVVPQLLHTLRDPARPMSVLARQLAQDPVLVAGVLKIARSPFYGLTRPVTSLEQAMLVIGQDGLRQMLASVAFKPIINLQSGDYTKRGAPRVWDQSERCGLACQVLAGGAGVSAFEAFLAALLQSVGVVVVLRMLDQLAPAHPPASPRACHLLLARARTLAATIGRQWSFPDAVIGAVLEREPSGAQGRTVLGDLVASCDALSKLRVLADARVLAADDERLDLAGHPALQRCFQMLDAAPT
jgi:HD-like signal output (HDOD) protein